LDRVFVYGTLKKGFPNHERIFKGYEIKITEAWAYGELYDLGWGFPAMVIDYKNSEISGDQDSTKVYGELIDFGAPQLLLALDRLEGFIGHGASGNFYNRIKRTVHTSDGTIQVWVYVITPEMCLIRNYRKLPSGIWE